MSGPVHIVCLDAPSPPDYGGAIDMFCKIKALAGTGKRIILHYFDYRKGRGMAGLENFCEEVHAYERASMIRSFSFGRPLIVGSRISKPLIARLNQDDHPVILEGIHCTGILPFIRDHHRIVIRLHNEETAYYRKLAQSEIGPFRQFYFRMESRLLRKYYARLPPDTRFACLSQADAAILQQQYGFGNIHFIPCFLPWQSIRSQEGRGSYCLYHGNMGISENESAALWLIRHVFSELDFPLVIAGRNISSRLKKAAKGKGFIRFLLNPCREELDALVRDAHINVLPSMNATGVKLKILHALFEGRFCLTNPEGAMGSGTEAFLTAAQTAEEWIQTIQNLMQAEFTAEDRQERTGLLPLYDNIRNARALSALW